MQKTEIINIKFNKEIDNLCFLSKNLYNYANFLVRQEFIKNKKWIRYYSLNSLCRENENYKLLPAQTSQQVLKLLDKNWKSFFKSIKDYPKNPNKYLGKPALPKYKHKTKGRNILIYPFQNLRIRHNKIKIPKTKIEFKLREEICERKINQVRIIPQQSCFKIEVIYEIEEREVNKEIKNVLSIDLGLNNFVTTYNNLGLKPLIVNGRIMKSINQYYNQKISKVKSELKIKNKKEWSKKLSIVTNKRNNKIKDALHKISRFLISYCIKNKIDTVVVGKNKDWKQGISIGKTNNQNFVNVPHARFIDILKYKFQEEGIKFLLTEESYTSKIDHLANEEMTHQEDYLGKRIKRGLFQSSVGKVLNSDVNGAIGIMRKVIENEEVFDSIQAVVFQPVKINVF